ncbi:general secretion pathway protein GspK [Pseudomonas sp. MAP12]|uniref:General secretion pathway protein GspK n=1 Tax=Geopseudomonas aromaticivorans TaxID=2849492 RepID=A0ABS6MT80_9GAMM|nr:type II secretion system protein GspK [Pseudomonas aromaticivorans]MBV2131599.1 general secretion pathway protein GspK [Pseudomonas aromaticivorans]
MVSVLWLLVLLSMLVINLSAGSRTELQLAGNLRQASSARHVTEAGVNWGMWSLMQTNNAGWLADGSSRTMELDGISVEVALFDEQGKIDLNEAGPQLLQGLFESVGQDKKTAEALAAAVIDWRDEDQLLTPLGAEKEEYEAAGLIGPSNDSFEELKDLLKVLGMTEELYHQVLPALTIYSKRAEVNPLVAPRVVLLALPGIEPGSIDRFIEERRRNFESGQRPPILNGVDPLILTPNAPGVNYSIVTKTTVSPTVQIRQHLLVHRRGGGQGFEVMQSTQLE